MPIGLMNFPDAKVPSAESPITRLIGSALNAYYTPQERGAGVLLKQAEANSKNAYANFTPSQIAATLLSSPALRDTADKDTINNLTRFASDQLTNGMRNTYSAQAQNQPSLLHSILSGLGFGSDSNSNSANTIPQQSTQQSQPITPVSLSQAAQNEFSSEPPKGTPEHDRWERGAPGSGVGTTSAVPTSTIGRIGAQVNNPGSSGGVNPAAVGAATEDALKATATSEANAYTDQWKKREDDNKNAADAATKDIQDNLNVLDSHKKMSDYEKGSFAGTIINPIRNKLGFESPAHQIFSAYANTRAAGISSGLSNGVITQEQAEMGRSMKVSDKNDDASVHHMIAYDNGVKYRILQKIAFEQQAKNNGLSPAQSDLLFYRYANEKPFWDNKNERILSKNFDYNSYFSPKMIEWAKKPSSINYLPAYLREENSNNENNSERAPTKMPPAANVQAEQSKGGYDPISILNYKYNNADEFSQAFNSLNTKNQAIVSAEMKRRGWH